MKKLALITTLLLTISLNGHSQDKQADIQKLFTVIQSDKMIDAVMDNVVTAMEQQQPHLETEEEKEAYHKMMSFVMEEAKVMTKQVLTTDMPAIYDKNFTHQEIKDMIAFFETPTGKKMIEKTPEIQKETMDIMMSKYMPAFQQKIMEKVQELQPADNHHHNLPPPPAPSDK